MNMKDSLFLLISNVSRRGCGTGRGPQMTMKDSLCLLISNVFEFRKDVWGWGGGPLMNMKDSLFLLISNVSKRGCGTGRRPANDGEGFFVSVDFRCFKKGMWDWEGAH